MAKKFRFRLAPVLRYREMIEKDKQLDFAKANRAVEEEQMHHDDMERERGEVQEAIREAYRQGEDFQRVVDSFQYINSLEVGMMMSQRKMVKLREVAEEKRKVFVEARTDKRALEILEERQREAATVEQAREEQQLIDEQGVRLRQRRDAEESHHTPSDQS